jgi:hypothetical protein
VALTARVAEWRDNARPPLSSLRSSNPRSIDHAFLGLGKSSRISRNSLGPRIRDLLRRSCSSAGIDLSTMCSTTRSANSDAFRAFRFSCLGSEETSARSTIRRIASGRDKSCGCLDIQVSNNEICLGSNVRWIEVGSFRGRPLGLVFVRDKNLAINILYRKLLGWTRFL